MTEFDKQKILKAAEKRLVDYQDYLQKLTISKMNTATFLNYIASIQKKKGAKTSLYTMADLAAIDARKAFRRGIAAGASVAIAGMLAVLWIANFF